jgi:hypothetical protein
MAALPQQANPVQAGRVWSESVKCGSAKHVGGWSSLQPVYLRNRTKSAALPEAAQFRTIDRLASSPPVHSEFGFGPASGRRFASVV